MTVGGPTGPVGLTATGGTRQIGLTWTASRGATSYTVKRSSASGGPYTVVPGGSGVTATSFTDTGLGDATTYYYVVTATDTLGEGSNSNQASATTAATTTLASLTIAPTSLLGGASATGTVTLAMAEPYAVTVTLASDKTAAVLPSPASVTVPANATQATFPITTSVVAGVTTATITATWNGSVTAALVINPPSVSSISLTPTSVIEGSPSQGTVMLSSPAPAGGLTVTLSATNATVPATVAVSGGQTVSAAFPVTTDKTVIATTATITASVSTTASQSATLALTPPVIPTGLSATPMTSQNFLTWTASPNATNYNIYRGTTSGGEATTPLTTVIGTNQFYDTAVTTGTLYFYTISAVNGAGSSGVSSEVSASPLIGFTLTVSPNSVGTGNSTTGTLTLTSPAPPGGFLVMMSASNTDLVDYSTELIVPAGDTVLPFTITTQAVTANTDIVFTATAYNSSSTCTATLSLLALPPDDPANIAAQDAADGIILSWSQPNYAVTYNIYRADSDTGPFTLLAGNVSGFAFKDTTAVAGNGYFYQVTAVNTAGMVSAHASQVAHLHTQGGLPAGFWRIQVQGGTGTFYKQAGSSNSGYQTYTIPNPYPAAINQVQVEAIFNAPIPMQVDTSHPYNTYVYNLSINLPTITATWDPSPGTSKTNPPPAKVIFVQRLGAYWNSTTSGQINGVIRSFSTSDGLDATVQTGAGINQTEYSSGYHPLVLDSSSGQLTFPAAALTSNVTADVTFTGATGSSGVGTGTLTCQTNYLLTLEGVHLSLPGPDPAGRPDLGDGSNQYVYGSDYPSHLYVPIAMTASDWHHNADSQLAQWLVTNNKIDVRIENNPIPNTLTHDPWVATGSTISTSVPYPYIATNSFAFHGLPSYYSLFGNHRVNLYLDGTLIESARIQTFFHGLDATNPGSYTQEIPNWYYYYNQAYPSKGQYEYYDFLGIKSTQTDTAPPYTCHYLDDAYHTVGPWTAYDIDTAPINTAHPKHLIEGIGAIYMTPGIMWYIHNVTHENQHQAYDLLPTSSYITNLNPFINVWGWRVGPVYSDFPTAKINTYPTYFSADGDGVTDDWENKHYMDSTKSDTATTGAAANDVADNELICDIPALGKLFNAIANNKMYLDWADEGVQHGKFSDISKANCWQVSPLVGNPSQPFAFGLTITLVQYSLNQNGQSQNAKINGTSNTFVRSKADFDFQRSGQLGGIVSDVLVAMPHLP